ncbi:TPR domain protein [marine gamma proteobacterium HTCC2143]|uniref:Lipopolysaccharide assembly protein B n=1 Tax=marine gamma proteobacterium HTCC2143 TaxID=247633 RepID=A0YFD6_9GAMM|nr:TPR domain protein [marine gamma proteobacterium HTCC2143]
MIADSWQFILVFIAIAIGWLLGRGSRVSDVGDNAPLHREYYKGLNYLLNDQPDNALDSFITSLEVNSETLETHIAVGNLMRRKGEVDRAIRIHQNLLSRPSLPRVHLHKAHLELARDFISAGLLDRAERLLKDLIEEAPELREISLRLLLEIYQDEKEWVEAIGVARQLLPRRSLLKAASPADKSVVLALSHYCCELAKRALDKDEYQVARTHVKKALSYDRNCVRASLLSADIEFQVGHYNWAIKSLRKVRYQDPAFIPETMELLNASYEQLDQIDEYYRYLIETLDYSQSVSSLLSVVENISRTQGDTAAGEFLGQQLTRSPSLRGLAKLVELYIANSDGGSKDNLNVLQLLIEQLMRSKPQYQCHHCGFSGKRLHWLCPSCKQWGQIKAIRGAEGE